MWPSNYLVLLFQLHVLDFFFFFGPLFQCYLLLTLVVLFVLFSRTMELSSPPFEIARALWPPLARQISYIQHLNENLEVLGKKMDKLIAREKDVKKEIDSASLDRSAFPWKLSFADGYLHMQWGFLYSSL